MNKIGLIIAREYKERVYKKSFIITTLLMPILLLALGTAPTLIMIFAKSDARELSVIDRSGIVFERLEATENVKFIKAESDDLQEELKRSLANEDFGVLYIGDDIIQNENSAQLYTNSSSSLMIEEDITRQLNDLIESERLKAYNIENLKEIMDKVEAHVSLTTFRNSDETESKASSAAASSFLGIVLGFVLYFFLAIYGGIVMQSIIEEKSSRILEVLVATVKPFDMMMGKILGVAAVAATQIAVWGVLLIILSGVILPAMLPTDLVANIEAAKAGADLTAMAQQGVDTEMITAVGTMLDTGYITRLIVLMLLFMIGGFLLYAAMYAAVGASVDQAQDAQQLTIPITMPIIIAFVTTTMVMNDPNSTFVVWCSMIPFTSPIVMMARIPSDIPTWEIIVSLVLLYATFVVMVWFAGKIYRIGIFMHGKKPTLKELWRWTKY